MMMIKKRYVPLEIKVKVIYHNVMEGFGDLTSEEDVDDARKSKQSTPSFLDYSFEDDESNPFDTY